ncbi:MAG: phosphatase PAP2 family protein [Bacteroidota bacterium]
MSETLQQHKNRIYPAAYWLLPVLLLLLADIWLVFISKNNIPDEKIFQLIAPHISEAGTSFMKKITFLGHHSFLIPANLSLISYFLCWKKGKTSWRIAVAALSSLGLMSLLKNLFQRQRPANPLVEGITNFGFPSGHAFMSVVFYGLLVWLAIKYIRNNPARITVIVLSLLLILLIGFSRIYLRVHYATDVVGGVAIGTCWLFFCLWLTEKISNRPKPSL